MSMLMRQIVLLLDLVYPLSLPDGTEGPSSRGPSLVVCWAPLFGRVLRAKVSAEGMDLFASTGLETPDG
jgi:hypothetical protein